MQLSQDGASAGGEFSYLLSKAQKPATSAPPPFTIALPGQSTIIIPGSAGVSPVSTPMVNPPLPYSLPIDQASRLQAQVCAVPISSPITLILLAEHSEAFFSELRSIGMPCDLHYDLALRSLSKWRSMVAGN